VAGVAAAALAAGGVATWTATGAEAPKPPAAEAATPEATGCTAGRVGVPTCRPTISLAGLAAVPIAAARRAAAERAAAERATADRAAADRHPGNQSAAGKPAKVGKNKDKNKNKNKNK
jgi:hypothetical protein